VRLKRGATAPLMVVVIGVGLGVAIAGVPSRHNDPAIRVAIATTTSTSLPSSTTTLPATTSTAATAPSTTPVTYVVKKGDTLAPIAQKFGVSVAAIVAANKLSNPNSISEGTVLVIPTAAP
jgi:LysM repeat protein